MPTFKRILVFIALLSLIVFINPTGHSYFHSALEYDWAMTPQSGFFALLGIVLLSIILFFFWSSWRSIEFIGKFIFIMVFLAVTFISYTLGAFDNKVSIAWYTLIVLYLFFIWGMVYPRLKFLLFRTRQVDDADTEA